jgi:hypothetical protein
MTTVYGKRIKSLKLAITKDCVSQLEQMAVVIENKIKSYDSSIDRSLLFSSLYGHKYITINEDRRVFANSVTDNINLIIREILEFSGYYMTDERLDKITIRAVYLVILNNDPLRKMIFETFKIMFYQAGVLPGFKQSILPGADEEEPEEEYMDRLDLIIKYQRSTDLLISKTSISKPLQVFLEQFLVDNLRRAFEITASREGWMLKEADIDLFRKIDVVTIVPYGVKDVDAKLSKEDVDKLGYRAGIPVISSKAHKSINAYASEVVSMIMHYQNTLTKENVEEPAALMLAINIAYGISFIIP